MHCVGDSHVAKYLFLSMSPRVRCHFVTGPMHSFATGRRAVDLRRLGVRYGCAVVFCYGDIDVRFHIGRIESEKGCGYDDVIAPLVESYLGEVSRRTMAVAAVGKGEGDGDLDDDGRYPIAEALPSLSPSLSPSPSPSPDHRVPTIILAPPPVGQEGESPRPVPWHPRR